MKKNPGLQLAGRLLVSCLVAITLLGAGEPTSTETTEQVVASEQTPTSEEGTSVVTPTAVQTVTDKLQGKEGVRIQTMCTHCNTANVQVGGLSADLAPVFRNDYPVIGGLATSIVLSILPSDTIVETKIAKGPSAAASPGPAAGGVIDLIEAKPTELPNVTVDLETGTYSLRSTELRLAGSIRPWIEGMIIAGIDRADAIDDDKDSWNDVAELDRSYAEGQVTLHPGTRHTVDLGVSWIDETDLDGRGAFDFMLFQGDPQGGAKWTREDTLFDRLEARGGWVWTMGQGRVLKFQVLDASRHQSVLSQVTAESQWVPEWEELLERFNIREESHWGSAEYEQTIGLGGLVHLGVERLETEISADTLIEFTTNTVPGTDAVQLSSLYADVEWRLSNAWNFRVGLRYDDATWEETRVEGIPAVETFESRSDQQLSPRLSVFFKPTQDWTLRLVGGETFRVPKPLLAEVCCGQKYASFVDTLAESGQSVGVEAIYQRSADLRANIYLSRTEFDHHILRVVRHSQGFRQVYDLLNIPDARAETAELGFDWSPTDHLSFNASFGWLSFENQGEQDITLDREGPTPPVTLSIGRMPYLSERTGTLSASLSLPGGHTITASGNYTGSMLIQQYGPTANPQNNVMTELRATPDFWFVNLLFKIPFERNTVLTLALNNLTDKVQDDLGDPSTDYNWGPLNGRSFQVGLRKTFGQQ